MDVEDVAEWQLLTPAYVEGNDVCSFLLWQV